MKGLSCKFVLKDGGFLLTDGVGKSRDNIWFYCIFNKFRIYTSDFGANLVSLVQKPIAMLFTNKTLIVGRLQRGIQKYVPGVSIRSIDIGYLNDDRKNLSMLIEYETVKEDNSVVKDVTFV